MTIRSDLTIDWGVSPRIIEVTSSANDISVQDFYDTLRSLGESVEAMDDDEIVDAGGKEGGVVAVTMTLFNALIKFKDTGTPRTCRVSGGNLFAVDENGDDMWPIAYNTNVTVIISQSTAAALVQDADIDAIKAKTDNLPNTPADESSIQGLSDKIGVPTSSTIADDLDIIETISQAIKHKTDGIPLDPAIQSLIEARIVAAFSEIKGVPWTDETLKLIVKKIEDLELQPYPSRAHVRL